MDGIHVAFGQLMVAEETDGNRSAVRSATHLHCAHVGDTGQILSLDAERVEGAFALHLVLQRIERYGEVVVDVVFLIPLYDLEGGIRLVGIVLEAHRSLEVEAQPESHVVLLARQIQQGIGIPAAVVDTLLRILGHTETLLLQFLHVGLHLLLGHTVVIYLILVGIVVGVEVRKHDAPLRLDLWDAILVVDGCRPLAVGKAAGTAT